MIRKTTFVLLACFISVFLLACNSEPTQNPASSNAAETATSSNIEKQQETTESSEVASPKVEKTIDAVAGALNLTDKAEVYYGMIGAKDGAEFNGGSIELYLFDEDSDYYQTAIEGTGMIVASAYKDGFVLAFPQGVEEDPDLVAAFNALEF